ncbi:MAG: hypothetical protein Q4G34_00715 [Micrococcus sp.]|nr:hypothetical protein [Micrococcus sp.]
MPQPIEVGSVLGGRYRVTAHVVTSADQDLVFAGLDQVLNRRVTILVASRENATQVATSARELATGEREDNVQVLDLGLSEGRTYLIAGGRPDPDVLLGMAYAQETYLEPFHTDTLGSEIFGSSREHEAQSYDDDEAYYTDLDEQLRNDQDQSQRRPGFLHRLSDRLSERVGSSNADGTAAKSYPGAAALAAADSANKAKSAEAKAKAEEAAQAEDEKAEQEHAEATSTASMSAPTASDTAASDDVEAGPAAEDRAADTRDHTEAADQEATEDSAADAEARGASIHDDSQEPSPDTAPVPVAPAQQNLRPFPARRAQTTPRDGDADPEATPRVRPALTRPAPRRAAAPGAPAPFPRVSREARTGSDSAADTRSGPDKGSDSRSRPTSSLASSARARAAGAGTAATAGAAGATGAAATPTRHDGAEDERPARGGGGGRWALAALLTVALLGVVVLGFWLLNQNRTPAASPAPTTTQATTEGTDNGAGGAESPTTQEPTEGDPAAGPSPEIASLSRVVPDYPSLDAENDAQLPQAIDGNESTFWQSYTYSRPNFGGFARSMSLVSELEQPAEVSAVTVTALNSSGGAFTVSLADSPGLEDAREVGSGTFDADQATVTLSDDAGEASYVVVTVTQLPQLATDTGGRPYGLRIAEISVD